MVDFYDDGDKKTSSLEADKSRRATAVALQKLGLGEDVLPKVTAAGYGKLAEEIIKIAFENGVKVREDKELAQMLAAIELDSDIPSEALIAVAEILSYVYKENSQQIKQMKDKE